MRAGDSVALGLRAFPSQDPMQGSSLDTGISWGVSGVFLRKPRQVCSGGKGPVGFLWRSQPCWELSLPCSQGDKMHY